MFVRLLVLWIYLVATSLHMVGASTTGVGSIVAGVWFLADTGTLLFKFGCQSRKSWTWGYYRR